MIDKFKQIISVFLVGILLITSVPVYREEAFGAGFSSIQVKTAEGVNRYDLKIKFDAASETLISGNGRLNNYRIYYRDLTGGGGEQNAAMNIPAYNGGVLINPVEVDLNMYLEPNSLYSFRVVPVYHITEGNITRPQEGSTISTYGILTNMEVEAVGEANTMTVEFDLPTVGGNHFFSEYNIYYANIDNSGGQLNWSQNPERVKIEDLQIDKGRAKHSYTNAAFEVGRIYAIKVEPIYNNKDRMDLHSTIVGLGVAGDHIFSSDIQMEYLTDKAYIKPNLKVDLNIITNVEISWDSLANRPLSSNIQRVELYQYIEGQGDPKIITFFEGASIQTTTHYSAPRPPADYTEYFIKVIYSDISYKKKDGHMVAPYSLDVYSNRGIYDPGAMEFAPYRPEIYDIKDNKAKPFELEITWKSFLREAFNDLEKQNLYGNTKKFLDKDVEYEIYITDNPANFQLMNKDQAIIADGNSLNEIDINGLPYYRQKFTDYYGNIGAGLNKYPLSENKIYYVKIVAIRNLTGQRSEPAYNSHYIMPIDKIPTNPNMISKPPLRIKLVDGAEVITDHSITVEWDEQWIELYHKNPDYVAGGKEPEYKWFSKVGIVDGALNFGDKVKYNDNILYKDRSLTSEGLINKAVSFSKIKNILKAYMNEEDIVLRLVDIRDSSYKMHVAEYNLVAEEGYDEYYKEISSPSTTSIWDTIAPKRTGAITLEFESAVSHFPSSIPMKEGMPYLIFIRPFVQSETGDKLAYYPSYVSSTTLKGRDPVEIDPVVPILEPVPPTTDTSVTVRFEYLSSLSYEIRFSDKYSDYSEGGILIDNEELIKNGRIYNDEKTGMVYLEYTIKNLFPKTRYYMWIRSKGTEKVSAWSNPVEMVTKDLEAPEPPKGLGPASDESLGYYNQNHGTDYISTDLDYLIVEWFRIAADMGYTSEEAPPVGEGEENALAQYLEELNIKESYMVKYNELIANRLYYIRAKTRLVFYKTEEGLGERSYTYIVELSLDPQFKDVVRIEVPHTASLENAIYKDSPWVEIVLRTEKSDTEYDGDKDPQMYPLPDSDFEQIYDKNTNTLTTRFRSNETGKDGLKDNHVDERFISRLVANKVFTYELDVSKYKNITPNNRIIEFPYTIISAFNDRQISLKIKADNMTITFTPGSLTNAQIKQLSGLDKNARLKIVLNQNPNGLTNENYVSTPHKISTSLMTGTNNVNFIYYEKPVNINFKLDQSKYVENMTNLSGYVIDQNTGGWQRLNSTYNMANKSMDTSTQKAATYSVIGRNTPASVQGGTIGDMYSVNAKLNITDIGIYDENKIVTPNQFNQIMNGALKNSGQVTMNQPLSQNDTVALGKSKLLITNTKVYREEAIASLVKLYEIKSKYPVSGYPNINETTYKDINNAGAQYKIPLLKASELGFYRGTKANPKGELNFGDLMHMLNIAINY